VLVVDDEEAVREVAVALLERGGFRASGASGGREAIERLRSGEAVDAVLLDLEMPDLSGAETLRALRIERPGLPVVIASGYTRADAAERVGTAQAFAFVAKPFRAERLVAAVESLLAGVPED
jgi:CheY-like chemotaxis protein